MCSLKAVSTSRQERGNDFLYFISLAFEMLLASRIIDLRANDIKILKSAGSSGSKLFLQNLRS